MSLYFYMLSEIYIIIIIITVWRYIYQYELSERRFSKCRDVIMSEVEAQHTTRADILGVWGMEGVTETVIPSPEVVDVRGPPLLMVGQVWRTGGMEDLSRTVLPTQTPPVPTSDIDSPILIILRETIRVNCVRKGAISVF